MKKLLAGILTIMMLFSLAACGEKEATQNGEIPTITWLVPGSKQDDLPVVLEAASKISVEKIGAKIDIQLIDDAAFTQRMNMNFASGSADYDICFTGYINPYKDAVLRGAYIPLDDYLKNSKIKEEIPDYVFETVKVNGEIYGVPNLQILAGCTGLFVSKKLADEAGFDTTKVKDLEDIEPFLKWVKENHPEIYPFRHGQYGGGTREGKKIVEEELTTGVRIVVDEDGSYEVKTKEEIANHYEQDLMRDWFEKGYIRPDAASAGNDNTDYVAGKYAAWRSWYKPGAEKEMALGGDVLECYAVQLSTPYMTSSAGNTVMIAINAHSKQPDLAFKMIELINTDKEFFNIICYGIEGKHYTLTEEGTVSFIKDSGYLLNSNWKFGNVFNSIPIEGNPVDIWEQTRAFNDSAIKSPVSGFSFDPTPVRTEIAQMLTVEGKYKNTFAKPTSEWREQYYNDMREAGVLKVKAEVEKQLKEWEETK